MPQTPRGRSNCRQNILFEKGRYQEEIRILQVQLLWIAIRPLLQGLRTFSSCTGEGESWQRKRFLKSLGVKKARAFFAGESLGVLRRRIAHEAKEGAQSPAPRR